MSQPVSCHCLTDAALLLFLPMLSCGVSIGFAEEPCIAYPSSQDQLDQPIEPRDIQERGLTNPFRGQRRENHDE